MQPFSVGIGTKSCRGIRFEVLQICDREEIDLLCVRNAHS